MSKRYQVVVSGSFKKHLREIGVALEHFKKADAIILAPSAAEAVRDNVDFVYLATDDPRKTADVLEKEFMAHITSADFLYLANIGGYVGRSTATEMGVAVMSGIPIVTAETIVDFSADIPQEAQTFLAARTYQRLSIDDITAENIAGLHLPHLIPANTSENETRLLQSLVTTLLHDLKDVTLVS